MKKPHCIVPWTWLASLPNGDVTPCCFNQDVVGNFHQQSVDEIWNSKKMRKLRVDMFRKDLPIECQYCQQVEDLGGESRRDVYNRMLGKHFDEVEENTNDDGSVKEVKIAGWDWRLSNKCNFSCRYCTPEWSSVINNNVEKNCASALNLEEFLGKHASNLEFIEFAGGETLLTDEHYYTLDRLIEVGNTDIDIWYNTNMSILKYKGKSVLDYWRKFNPDKLVVHASIDEIDERAEFLRKGTRWSVIEKNLIKVSKEKFNAHTNIVVSCYNIFRLHKIIERLTQIGWLSERYNYQNFILSFEFDRYHLRLIPEDKRQEIKQELYSYIDYFKKTRGVDLYGKFKHIILELDQPIENEKHEWFLRDTLTKDIDRGENTLKTFPELRCITDYVKK